MLGDFISLYIKAKEKNDVKKMRKIENDLSKVGMDKETLKFLVNELTKNRTGE